MALIDIDQDVVRRIQLAKRVSRVELARAMAVAPSTIGIHVDRLLDRGLLSETSVDSTAPGRPPKVLGLNPEAGQFVGVDVYARAIHGVSIDFAQQIIRDRTISLAASEKAETVVGKIQDVINRVRVPRRSLLGIGIACPGTVDHRNGIGLHYGLIRGWKDIPLANIFGRSMHVPIAVENNSRVMALAERWFGAANDVASAICIGNRSGIGSGIMIDGELYRGSHGLAGEIGSWATHSDTGESVTLEEAASLQSILSRLAAHVRSGQTTCLSLTRNQITSESLFDAIQSNDRLTLRVLSDAAKVLGGAVAQMVMLLNPEKVILCGPLAGAESRFIDPLRSSIVQALPTQHAHKPQVVGSTLGDLVGAMGAAALAAKHWQPNLIN